MSFQPFDSHVVELDAAQDRGRLAGVYAFDPAVWWTTAKLIAGRVRGACSGRSIVRAPRAPRHDRRRPRGCDRRRGICSSGLLMNEARRSRTLPATWTDPVRRPDPCGGADPPAAEPRASGRAWVRASSPPRPLEPRPHRPLGGPGAEADRAGAAPARPTRSKRPGRAVERALAVQQHRAQVYPREPGRRAAGGREHAAAKTSGETAATRGFTQSPGCRSRPPASRGSTPP